MAGKRKSNIGSDVSQNEAARPPKASRLIYSPDENSTGQRLGESAEFIPLPALSQDFGVDEEDDQAADVVQGSQEVDESSLTTYILYGMHSSIALC
jgi:SWI/SNF-related matrix-associated actin-dependent regulator of chromatin subfamily A3